MKIIKCRDCQEELTVENTSKKILCENCKTISQSNHFKNILIKQWFCKKCNVKIKETTVKGKALVEDNYEQFCKACRHSHEDFEREIRCRHCDDLIGKEVVKKSYQTKEVIYKTCAYCLENVSKQLTVLKGAETKKLKSKKAKKNKEKIEKQIEDNSLKGIERVAFLKEQNILKKIAFLDSMLEKDFLTLSSNVLYKCALLAADSSIVNRYDKIDIIIKLINKAKKEKKKTNSKALSERMKKNNPMSMGDIKQKVSETLKRKYEEGTISNPKGEMRYNYKGENTLLSHCRSILYRCWTRPILERDNFKCTICGETKNLQVHHIRPFIKIINLLEEKYNTSFRKITPNNCEKYEEYANAIVQEHVLEDGITVCKVCHEKIDYQYRPTKGRKKNERDENIKNNKKTI